MLHACQHQNILFERTLAAKLSNTPKMIFISHLQPLQISNKAKCHAFFEKFSHWKLKPAPTQDNSLNFYKMNFHTQNVSKKFFFIWMGGKRFALAHARTLSNSLTLFPTLFPMSTLSDRFWIKSVKSNRSFKVPFQV